MTPERPEKLIYMANQIAKYFAAQPGDAAAAGVADHLRSFWDPTMRARIAAWVAGGGDGLDPAAAQAVALLEASSDHAG